MVLTDLLSWLEMFVVRDVTGSLQAVAVIGRYCPRRC